MKLTKILKLAACVLAIGTTFTSCLNDDDDADITYQITDFMDMSDGALTVTDDFGKSYYISNSSAVTAEVGSEAQRIWCWYSISYNSTNGFSNTVTIMGLTKVASKYMVEKEEVPETAKYQNAYEDWSVSATPKHLNIRAQAYTSKDCTSDNFHCYIDRISGSTVYIHFACDALDAYNGSKANYAFSFNLKAMLEKHRSEITPSNGKITLCINENANTTGEYEWE